MTDKKKLKNAIRVRALEQGLSYTQARRKMIRSATSTKPTCHVPGCGSVAAVEVFLHDEYVDGLTFHEQDFTCPFLCEAHKEENEVKAEGLRRPRGVVRYPYTNAHWAQGWSMYRQL